MDRCLPPRPAAPDSASGGIRNAYAEEDVNMPRSMAARFARNRRNASGERFAGAAQAAPANAIAANRGQRVLLGACIVVLALVVAPPFLAAAGSPYAQLVRWLAHPVCHQIAERSFHLLGEAVAVCHRCTGLYVGFALGVALWPHMASAARWLADHPRAVVFFLAPVGVDLALDNTVSSRFATGTLAGFPVALLALLAIERIRADAWQPANASGSDSQENPTRNPQ